MKKFLHLMIGVFLSILIIGCSNPNELTPEKLKTIKFLNASEMKELFSDVKIIGNSYKYKSRFEIDFKSDGTYSGTVADGKKSISGTWSLDGILKCMVVDGKESCVKHFKEGDKYYAVKENIISSDFIIQK